MSSTSTGSSHLFLKYDGENRTSGRQDVKMAPNEVSICKTKVNIAVDLIDKQVSQLFKSILLATNESFELDPYKENY